MSQVEMLLEKYGYAFTECEAIMPDTIIIPIGGTGTLVIEHITGQGADVSKDDIVCSFISSGDLPYFEFRKLWGDNALEGVEEGLRQLQEHILRGIMNGSLKVVTNG